MSTSSSHQIPGLPAERTSPLLLAFIHSIDEEIGIVISSISGSLVKIWCRLTLIKCFGICLGVSTHLVGPGDCPAKT